MTSNFIRQFEILQGMEAFIKQHKEVYAEQLQASSQCDDHAYSTALNRLITAGKVERWDEKTTYTLNGKTEEVAKIKYAWVGNDTN